MRKSISPIPLTAMLAGCHTLVAVGRHLQKLGDKIEKKAEQEKRS